MDEILEARARRMFIRTRDAMGWREPEWEDLAEETRQTYRDELKRRDGVQVSDQTNQ